MNFQPSSQEVRMSRLVTIATAVDPVRATLIQSQLEAYNIRVLLSHESAGTAYGLTVGALGLVDVLVAEAQAQEAKAILDESSSPPSGAEPDA
jgi:hypothetical protein